jgi:hypothetical protein
MPARTPCGQFDAALGAADHLAGLGPVDDHVVVVEGVKRLHLAGVDRLRELADLDPPCLVVYLPLPSWRSPGW